MEKRLKLFNGKYTIRNRRSGEHRTFMIKTKPDDSKFAAGERVVSLLTGPDNEADYTGFGFLKNDGIVVWKSKRGKDGQRSPYEIYADMLWSLGLDGAFSKFADAYEFMMEGHCAVCNRTLTEPESIISGIGPVCMEKSMVLA